MKLRTKLFTITDSKGEEINVEGSDIVLALNGERIETKLADIFSDLEFDDGEIYGNSLLSYYKVNDDGSLEVEGSRMQLIDASTNEPILIKGIKRPSINDDTNIPFEHVQKFVEYFKVAKPDEVFDNLNEEEKQVFISERTTRHTKKSESEASKAEADRTSKQQAEAKLKASIHPADIQEKKDYLATQSFYAGIDFKEYIKHDVHVFYGTDAEQPPCVLIKRGETWWQELNDAQVVDKTAKGVTVEYMDGKSRHQAVIDIAKGEVIIMDMIDAE